MNEELKIIIKAVTDSAEKSIKKVSGELDSLGKSAKASSSKVAVALKAIGTTATVAIGAIGALGAAFTALGKRTLEFQREQAKLVTAFQAAGASAETAAQAYDGLYRFLGDSSKATEAAAHLAKITTNQEHLAEWTKISQGIYATFGDSLPIEGLTEAANETIRVGKVTGTMADALNWAGVSEDAFNAKLATTNSLAEREALTRQTLTALYEDAYRIYEKNNAALLAYNESQAQLDRTMSAAGQATLPLMTALNNLGSAFFVALKPAIDAIIPPLAMFIEWMAKAIQTVTSFFGVLTGNNTTVKAFGEIGGAAQGAAQGLGSAQKAAGGMAKAAEDAKKSTQGFDELNIVSSGASGSSGSGSSGAPGGSGYGSGGSGLLDPATFGAEVQETESKAGGLANKIKEIFGKVAEVFQPTTQAWTGAFDTMVQAWNKAKPDYITGANEILQAFQTLGTFLATDYIPNIFNAFSVNIAPMIGEIFGFIIEEFGKQFAWLGGYVNTLTNDILIPFLDFAKSLFIGIFEAIGGAWDESGGYLLDQLSVYYETLREIFDNFYNSVFKPLWDKILEVLNVVWTDTLQPLIEKVISAVLDISAEILVLYNEVLAPVLEWIMTKILPPVVAVVNSILDVVKILLAYVGTTIGAMIDIIVGIIKFVVGVFTGDWKKAWEGIQKIFGGIWDMIKGYIDYMLDLLGWLVDFVKTVLVSAFKIAWEAIKFQWDSAVKFFKIIWEGIVLVFSVVGEWFSDTFTGAWEGIKDAWSAVGDWFSGVWGKITNAFKSVSSWFKQMFSDAWTNIKNVFSPVASFFGGIWDTIKKTFTSLGTSLGDAIGGAVKKGINNVISMIEKTINTAINMINGALKWINAIPGVNLPMLGTLKLPRLAKGGIVDSATIAMIGEQGKEAIVPLENNTEWIDKLVEKLNVNSGPSKIVLMLDGKELGWANIHSINNITKQTGKLQLALV